MKRVESMVFTSKSAEVKHLVLEFIVKPALKKNLDNDKIKELKDAGWTNKDIASMYGVSDRTIRNRLKSMDKKASI